MAVTVRFFAALRDAAGVDRVEVASGDLQDILDDLRGRFGARFADRLRLAAVMVDGDPVPATERRDLPDGTEVALLPPFAGGATPLPRRSPVTAVASPDPLPLPAVLAGAALAAAALLPTGGFATAVVALALLVTLDLAGLIERALVRPLVLVVALVAIVAPTLVAVRDDGVTALPATLALAVLGTFWLVLVSRRRAGAVEAVGVTLLALGITGLGGGALVALHGRAEGTGLILGLLLVTVPTDVVLGVLAWLRPRLPLLVEVAVPLVVAAAAGAVLAAVVDGPVEPLTAARWVLVAVGAAVTGRRLRQELRSGGDTAPPRRAGQLAGAGVAVLLAAPLALVVAP